MWRKNAIRSGSYRSKKSMYFSRIFNDIRTEGIGWVLLTSLTWYQEATVRRVSRNWRSPKLRDLAGYWAPSPTDALTQVVGASGSTKWKKLSSEYAAVEEELKDKYKEHGMLYPREFAIEEGTSFLLYASVRLGKPSIVLETGVANGHSSFFIISALNSNEKGILHSIDISPNVGRLIDRSMAKRWRLHILSLLRAKSSFLKTIGELGKIDIFIHDSNHSYGWQCFEYMSVIPRMAKNGIFMSDDVNSSLAFSSLCNNLKLSPILLDDKRKVFGLFLVSRLGAHL